MDARESRRYLLSNPPVDSLIDRRPSLLGRLFRRTSSIDEGTGVIMGSSPPTGTSLPNPTTLEIDLSGERAIRRVSITETVQAQFLAPQKKPIIKQVVDPEFGIFT